MMETDNYNGQEIGNYRLVEKLDCGSYGCVYRAEHLHLKKHIVAIKLLHAHLASPQKSAEFLQEAQFLYDLRHPYILPVLDVGIYEKTIPYLVVEYCPYGSLKQYLQHQIPSLLSVEEAVSILTKIGQALHYAHQHNIVHRDLKPANILFKANGEVMLADFGIAVLLEGTTFINPYGTPAYMAPEQFQGIVSKKSDQFALGCIAYELMTGQKPFLHSRIDTPIPPSTLNPLVPPHVEKAIIKALSERHTDRYEDIVTFVNALEKTAPLWLDEGKTVDHTQKYDEDFAVFQTILKEVLSTGHSDQHEDVVPFVNAPEKSPQLWLDEGNTFYHGRLPLDDKEWYTARRWLDEGNTFYQLQKYDEALVAFEQAIHLDSNLAAAYCNKGVALSNLMRYEEALASFEQAIRLNSNYSLACYNKGIALANLRRYEEALVAYEQAIHLNPNHTTDCTVKEFPLPRMSSLYYELRHERATRLDPHLALDLENIKHDEKTLIVYGRAFRLEPNLADAYYNKGIALANLKRYEEALATYEQAIHLNPNHSHAHYSKGITLTKLGKSREAEQAYEKARQLGYSR
jgi:serine/threonine protein kinase